MHKKKNGDMRSGLPLSYHSFQGRTQQHVHVEHLPSSETVCTTMKPYTLEPQSTTAGRVARSPSCASNLSPCLRFKGLQPTARAQYTHKIAGHQPVALRRVGPFSTLISPCPGSCHRSWHRRVAVAAAHCHQQTANNHLQRLTALGNDQSFIVAHRPTNAIWTVERRQTGQTLHRPRQRRQRQDCWAQRCR